jgi:salicylate hydroxylase
VTQREDEAKETWRAMNQEKQEEFKNGPLSNWGFEGEGLVKRAEKLVKVEQKRLFYLHTGL